MESEYGGKLKIDYNKAAELFSSEEAKGVLIFSSMYLEAKEDILFLDLLYILPVKNAENLPPTSTTTLGGGAPYVLVGVTKKLKDLSKLYAPSPSLAKTTIVPHNISVRNYLPLLSVVSNLCTL